jgi:hypothetical protein
VTDSRASARPMTRLLARIAVSLSIAAGLILGFAGTAAPASADGCLSFTHSVGIITQTVMGYNNCSQTQGFMVTSGVCGLFGCYYETSTCISVAPNTSAGWKWPRGRPFLYESYC